MKTIMIGDKMIGEGKNPFLIAEIGVNFYDIAEKLDITPIDAAKLMIKEAKEAGADAVKFQVYKAEKLASQLSPAYWDVKKESTRSQYDLFKKYDKFSEEDWRELADYSLKLRIVFLSTPFYKEAVDFLDELVPAFKISSSDITNLPLVRYIARKGKPVLLSTGASTIGEIEEAISIIRNEGNSDIVIMHCTLCYPTEYEYANLNAIKYLKNVFPDYIVGYSDHTLPDENMLTLTVAYLLGAQVIEKHFTLDKTLPGNDHYHSMDPADIRKFRRNIELITKIMGKYEKKPLECEVQSRKYARRSLVAKHSIKKNATITENDLVCKRPGTGIPPKFLSVVVGKKAKRDIREDEVIT
ncbi:MAG: N-acetylneuraminate synthase family protein, partial [Candidatus Odinarchaeia archaeon]